MSGFATMARALRCDAKGCDTLPEAYRNATRPGPGLAAGFVHEGLDFHARCEEHDGHAVVLSEWSSLHKAERHWFDVRAVLMIDPEDGTPLVYIEVLQGHDALGNKRWVPMKDGHRELASYVWLTFRERVVGGAP